MKNEEKNIEKIDEDLNDSMVDFDEDENVQDDVDVDDNEIDEFELLYKLNTNKHRQEGKHKLKRDTLFKGKEENKDKALENDITDTNSDYNDIVNFFKHESDSYDEYVEQNNLTKDVHDILSEKTNIDFSQNRRKPNRETFNNYYNILLKELGYQYTKSEIFVTLSYYFTDNIFNMFKLLDKVPATIIIKELSKKGYLKDLDGIKFL